MKSFTASALTATSALLLFNARATSARCLEAEIGPSNGDRYPDANGFVTVCFDNEANDMTDGTLEMFVTDLKVSTTGGVHIHSGTSCANQTAQGGHYFNSVTGDPWFNTPTPGIAPTGAGYNTDTLGTGRAGFNFDQGYGYDLTVGKVVVIHDTTTSLGGDYARVACGVLRAAGGNGNGLVSREKWYADSMDRTCRMDCDTGIATYCGGIQNSRSSSIVFYDTVSSCCSSQYSYKNANLCAAIATDTHTNMYYADTANSKCSKDCEVDSGAGLCQGYPRDLSTMLFDSASSCCTTRLGWLPQTECVANTNDVTLGGCLEARISSSNGGPYSTADGYITVCFDGKLSETSGTMEMYVQNLNTTTEGGVHVHSGTSCANSTAQGGHYFNPVTGDPWFNAVNSSIAPTGTGYTTNAVGTGRADFRFDQGYGYDLTVGRVVVVHDTITSLGGDYARVSCGVLAATEKVGTKKWYPLEGENAMSCVQDCKTGFEDHCGGLRENNFVSIYDTAEACCAAKFNQIDSSLCEARSKGGYTNKFYVNYLENKCSKDCKEGTGACAGSPDDSSLKLYDSAESCCSSVLGWLDQDLCVEDTISGGCLQARMSSSNGGPYSTADGYITVCFDGKLSETSGTMEMYVQNLNTTTEGGVHVHSGTSCANAAMPQAQAPPVGQFQGQMQSIIPAFALSSNITFQANMPFNQAQQAQSADSTAQGGHYFNPVTGDPWFNAVNSSIAPTGTGYTTNAAGTGRADFQFDQGYGYDLTVGRVVVVHDTITSLGGDYARVSCGVLTKVEEELGTKLWYADSYSENQKCVRDCKAGFEDNCGGVRDNNFVPVHDSVVDCCTGQFSYMDSELCVARSTGTYTNKFYVNWVEQKCSKHCDGCNTAIDLLSGDPYDSAEACCTGRLGWLDRDECVAASVAGMCLEARMSSSNGGPYSTADGYITVCFDGKLSETSGTLRMRVENLNTTTEGGVHVHSGTSCANSTAQGGHYFNPVTGDPWFNAVNSSIAPTGTGYTTDAVGTGRADFQFDQGYGYDLTVGRAVVVHDTITSLGGDYARVSCGVLRAADPRPFGTEEWYIDNNHCVKDCVGSTSCGGLAQSWNILYPTASECCGLLTWVEREDCVE